MITSLDQLDLNKKYTYADYLTWQFKERVELLRGYIRKMSPAPSEYHQRISSFLHGMIWSFLRGKKCQVRHAPYDVRLIIPVDTKISDNRRKKAKQVSNAEIETVVQPDLLVICDPTKIDSKGCIGAPNLVVEILSKGNNRDDLTEKFSIYESAKVPEYWIIHPYEQTVIVYTLDSKGQYVGSKPFASGMMLNSIELTDLSIPVTEIFE